MDASLIKDLEKELEKVLTIDGRGRPAKAAYLLKLIEHGGLAEVIIALQEIEKRKWF